MEPLRTADGFSGLLVIAAIYFVLSLISRGNRRSRHGGASAPRPAPEESGVPQQETLSLDRILREIQRVKQQRQQQPLPPTRREVPARSAPPARRVTTVPGLRPAAPTERGPLGRHDRVGLPDDEDVEDRESLEGAALGGQSLGLSEEEARRRQRVVVDHDEEAQALVQKRIREAEARNRPLTEMDHKAFDREIRQDKGPAPSGSRYTAARLRDAVVWREIMGPPKALE